MNHSEKIETYLGLCRKYGIISQLCKLVEEVTELIRAEFKGNRQEILEEAADVKILIEQFEWVILENLKEIYGFTQEDLIEQINKKLIRVKKEHLSDGEESNPVHN